MLPFNKKSEADYTNKKISDDNSLPETAQLSDLLNGLGAIVFFRQRSKFDEYTDNKAIEDYFEGPFPIVESFLEQSLPDQKKENKKPVLLQVFVSGFCHKDTDNLIVQLDSSKTIKKKEKDETLPAQTYELEKKLKQIVDNYPR